MAEAPKREIRALMIPIEGGNLVLPDVAIAQIMSVLQPVPIDDAPPWFLGMVPWQKQEIPLISFEVASGMTTSNRRQLSQAVVIKVLGDNEALPCYGIVMSDIPHPVRITGETILPSEDAADVAATISCNVQIDGEDAMIPDLDALESMIIEHMPAKAA
ncbi:MAG: chemotaxis protein CheW [Gammaproteobacteria bacterium]|nr:MAG: chemotaxis protein CheW [Gammaproteobacteria bacterium]